MRKRYVPYLSALALAMVGCITIHEDLDLALPARPEVTMALPLIEPGADPAQQPQPQPQPQQPQLQAPPQQEPPRDQLQPEQLQQQPVRLVRRDDAPERLPAPRSDDKAANNAQHGKDGKDSKKGDVPRHPDGYPIGGQISLALAVQECLAADPKLKAAAELIAKAQSELTAAATAPNPIITSLASFIPLFHKITPYQQGGPPQYELDVSYPIDWYVFGKLAAASASAQVGVQVSEFDYADTVRLRVGEVVVAYYDILEAQGLIAIARQDLESLKRTEATLEQAVKAGGKAQVDLNRVRLDRVRSAQVLREAEATLNIARTRLHALMGRPDTAPAFEAIGSIEGTLPGGEVATDALYAAAAQSRPDIRSAQTQVARAEADIVAEDRKAYPQMNARGGWYHQFQRTSIGFMDADTWGLGFDMTLPCSDRNQGARQKARANLVQQQHELQNALVELRAEIERLTQEYRTASANAQAISGQLRLAADVREAIATAYQNGGRSLLELLDAQRAYRETYRLNVSNRAALYRAAYRLQNATGVKLQP